MFKSRAVVLALAAIAALTFLGAGSADACWRCHGWGAGYGWGGGYWPAYRTGYWSGYSSYYGWGGYYGGYGGCSSCGWGGCGSGGCSTCGSGGCSTCGYSSSYWGYPSYYQSYYSDTPGNYYPTYYSPPTYGGCSSCMSAVTTSISQPSVVSSSRPAAPAATGEVVFTIRVPADAKVFVNDRPTTSTGTLRSYSSRGLLIGYQYGFTVRSERVVGGRLLSETQNLRLTAGQTGQLAFNLTAPDTQVAQEVRPLRDITSSR